MRSVRGGISRREFLAYSSAAAGMLASGGAIASPRIVAAPTAPVAVSRVSGYDQDLVAEFDRMFDLLGGIGHLVRGKTVGIKLNLTGASGKGRRTNMSAGQSTWVHPNVVGALTASIGKQGAKRIRLLESVSRKGFGALEDAMLQDGWDVEAIRNAAPKVEMEDTNGIGEGQKYSILPVKSKPYIYPGFAFNHSYEDCDFFVSLAKMKNHEELGITLSMKNLFGITPEQGYGMLDPVPAGTSRWTRERVFHYGQVQPPAGVPQEIDFKSNRYEGWRMPRLLTDICGARPIDLAVIDGIETIVGGESTGIPGTRPAKPRLLVVGLNCVCTDTVAMATMGYNPRAGRHEAPFVLIKAGHPHPAEQVIAPGETEPWADNILLVGEAAGLGTADLGKIDVRGVPIKDAVFDFEAHKRGQAPA